jgi:hypothetical protein
MRQSRNVLTIVLLGLFGVAAVAYAATRHHHPILLGDRGVERHAGVQQGGRATAFRFSASASGTGRWVSLYLGSRNKAKTVKVAIYKDSKGRPGRLLGSGADRHPRAGAWNHIRIGNVAVRRHSMYWIAVLGIHGAVVYRNRAHGTCDSQTSSDKNLGGFTRTWHGHGSAEGCPISAVLSTKQSVSLGKSGGKPPGKSGPGAGNPGGNPGSPGGNPGSPGGTPAPPKFDCFHNLVACGYPSPSTAGVPAGTSLTPSGSISVNTAGTVISNRAVTGTIDVYASNVVIKDTMVTSTDTGVDSIMIHSPATNVTIQDTTVAGADGTPAGRGIHNTTGTSITVTRVYIHNDSDGVVGLQHTSDSYIITDGLVSGAHVEPVYLPGAGSSNDESTVIHNTLLNPQGQVSAVFADCHTYGACWNMAIENNLMEGGDFTVECCDGSGAVSPSGNTQITGNRFARVYYRNSGVYGPTSGVDTKRTTYSGNIYDDNGASVPARL